jgi:hypothetical protein
MSKFKIWFETREAERDRKLGEIWTQAFRVFGLEDPSDISRKTLEQATSGAQKTTDTGNLVNNLLNNVYRQMEELGMEQQVQAAKDYATQQQDPHGGMTPAKKDVEGLMRHLFADQFDVFLNNEPRSSDAGEQPAPDPATQAPDPNRDGGNITQPPPEVQQPGPEGQQPQVPEPGQTPMMNPPTHPMPPVPAGAAKMGWY